MTPSASCGGPPGAWERSPPKPWGAPARGALSAACRLMNVRGALRRISHDRVGVPGEVANVAVRLTDQDRRVGGSAALLLDPGELHRGVVGSAIIGPGNPFFVQGFTDRTHIAWRNRTAPWRYLQCLRWKTVGIRFARIMSNDERIQIVQTARWILLRGVTGIAVRLLPHLEKPMGRIARIGVVWARRTHQQGVRVSLCS